MTNKQTHPDTNEIGGVKYQKVEEPQGPKTLYQMFYDDELPAAQCKILCEFVEEWMSQVHPHDMSFGNLTYCNITYCNGFFDAIEALRSKLR